MSKGFNQVRSAFGSRRPIVVALALAIAVALGGGTATAAVAGVPKPGEAVKVEVAMALDCVNLTPTAREYALTNKICTPDGKAVQSDVSTNGTVEGTCGTSWIYIFNAYRGMARFLYGYNSTQGAVAAHWLTINWANWTRGTANNFGDSGSPLSSYFQNAQNKYTDTGWVNTALSGTVLLWWGGTCTLLNPTDGAQIGW
jgi:hypothetical protein